MRPPAHTGGRGAADALQILGNLSLDPGGTWVGGGSKDHLGAPVPGGQSTLDPESPQGVPAPLLGGSGLLGGLPRVWRVEALPAASPPSAAAGNVPAVPWGG